MEYSAIATSSITSTRRTSPLMRGATSLRSELHTSTDITNFRNFITLTGNKIPKTGHIRRVVVVHSPHHGKPRLISTDNVKFLDFFKKIQSLKVDESL